MRNPNCDKSKLGLGRIIGRWHSLIIYPEGITEIQRTLGEFFAEQGWTYELSPRDTNDWGDPAGCLVLRKDRLRVTIHRDKIFLYIGLPPYQPGIPLYSIGNYSSTYENPDLFEELKRATEALEEQCCTTSK